ncbi:MAG: sigma-70 family RNA polymerase sigma factor [Stellaceae bacterium]
MTASEPGAPLAIEPLLRALRPQLHRYCARMTGSVIDGEDVVQEALLKAMEALPASGAIDRPDSWLFRIAHNAALDHLRRRAREAARRSTEDPDMTLDPANPTQDREIAAMSLSRFMRLPVAQRSSVILMDVLGYSLEEIGGVTEMTVPAVKAALHRGRTSLRALAGEPEEAPPPLEAAERARLAAYIERFNARDFDALRDMLAEEVQLELVSHLRLKGRKAVSPYFHRYGEVENWRFGLGQVDRRPAILVHDPARPETPKYFVLLDWAEGKVINIRDFLFAPYAIEGAEVVEAR